MFGKMDRNKMIWFKVRKLDRIKMFRLCVVFFQLVGLLRNSVKCFV